MMRRIGLGFVCVVALWGNCAQAQTAFAPSMFGVQEVVVQYPRISNDKAASECGLSREDITSSLYKVLKLEAVPVLLPTEARMPNPAKARMDLFPEIAVLTPSAGDCLAWVSLNAQSTATVAIPPVTVPRSILITYWRSGQLIASGQSVHARLVRELFLKLGRNFARQYQLDQPPTLPDYSATEGAVDLLHGIEKK